MSVKLGAGFRGSPGNRRDFASPRAGPRGEKLLHDPVFERMEGDNSEPSAKLQRAFGCREPGDQFAKLVVDRDA